MNVPACDPHRRDRGDSSCAMRRNNLSPEGVIDARTNGEFQGPVSSWNCSNNGLNSRRGPSVPSAWIGTTL